jgi:phage terminase large subunit-like protein
MSDLAVYQQALSRTVGAITGKAHVDNFSDKQSYRKYTDEWLPRLRPNQRTPEGDWFIWLIRAGRGWGKTLTGALWMLQKSEHVPYIAIVAATYGDGRDYCIEGETGIRTICSDVEWNRSMGEMTFPSGCKGKLFSAEEPDRMRGPNIYAFWCDEYAAWKYRKAAFRQLLLMARKGDELQGVITTTPKPGALKELEARPTTIVTRGTTRENIDNLSPVYIREVVVPLEGTTLGRQELEGQDIEDAAGALWKREELEAHRVTNYPDLVRIVVSIDPAATSTEDSDQTGLSVGGIGTDKHAYVLDAKGMRATPNEWAHEAVSLYHKYKADLIIGEANNGGDMIEALIRAVDPTVNYKKVHASRGKVTRAEPIAAFYEKGMVHHVGTLPALEDQLCQWEQGMESPDLLDADVWMLSELMLGESGELSVGTAPAFLTDYRGL